MTWSAYKDMVVRDTGTFWDPEEKFVICPCCSEPIYEDDYPEIVFGVCPVCDDCEDDDDEDWDDDDEDWDDEDEED